MLRIGLVVVVSPLIALMRDQLRALEALGLPAAALHSGEDDFEIANAYEGVASGRVKLLYVAPEGLAREGTLDLLRKTRVALLAVDEAHCISHWGHDFRPEYGRLGELARSLGKPPILAVTASAGPRTRDDIAALLFPHPPEVFLRSFARAQPLAGLSRAARRPASDSPISWSATPDRAESSIATPAARWTCSRAIFARLGFDALPYHAGQDGEERSAHQDAFFAREGVVMVATIAFGMGVDKPERALRRPRRSARSRSRAIIRRSAAPGATARPAAHLLLFDRRELARRWRPPAALANDPSRRRRLRAPQAMARLCVAPGCRFEGFARGVWRSRRGLRTTAIIAAECSPRRAAPRLFQWACKRAALSWMTGLWDDAGGLEDLGPEETPPAAVEEPALSRRNPRPRADGRAGAFAARTLRVAAGAGARAGGPAAADRQRRRADRARPRLFQRRRAKRGRAARRASFLGASGAIAAKLVSRFAPVPAPLLLDPSP